MVVDVWRFFFCQIVIINLQDKRVDLSCDKGLAKFLRSERLYVKKAETESYNLNLDKIFRVNEAQQFMLTCIIDHTESGISILRSR